MIKLLKFAPGAAWHGSGAPASTVVKDISATVSSHGDHGISCIWLASTGDFLYTTHMKVDARWGPTGCVDSGIPDNRALNTIAGCNVYGVLSRFPVAADGALGDEQVIYDTQDAVHLDAGGVDRGNGCVQFSTHSVPVAVTEQGGFLFVSHGDGAGFSMVDAGQLGVDQGGCNDNPGYRGAFRSQDPHRLNGKILRWTVGATPADFSFVVWSSGHRNPFRLSPDPARDRILQSETGWYLVEESACPPSRRARCCPPPLRARPATPARPPSSPHPTPTT